MKIRKNKGFVALISVLMITAVAMIIGVAITMRTISRTSISLFESQSTQAWSSANGCVELAISQLGVNSTSTWASALDVYNGGSTVSIGGIPCYLFDIVSYGVNDYRLIKASSTVGEYIRKLQVVVATNTPQIIINSWQEVGDFTLP
jgi:hypothetical protein